MQPIVANLRRYSLARWHQAICAQARHVLHRSIKVSGTAPVVRGISSPVDSWAAQVATGGMKKTDLLGKRPPKSHQWKQECILKPKNPRIEAPDSRVFSCNKMGQSASGIICDQTDGKFGPFGATPGVRPNPQHGHAGRAQSKVNGVYQGACFPFFAGDMIRGNLPVCWPLPDGSLFVGGTDRGWGARGRRTASPFSVPDGPHGETPAPSTPCVLWRTDSD